MKFIAQIGERQIPIDITRSNDLYHLTIGEKSFSVDAIRPNPKSLSLLINGISYEVGLDKNGNRFSLHFYNDTIELEIHEARKFHARELVKKAVSSGPFQLIAPMPGKVIQVSVEENMQVQEGDSLLVIEAMKMQNELKAPHAGTVKQIRVKEGEAVSAAHVLLVLE